MLILLRRFVRALPTVCALMLVAASVGERGRQSVVARHDLRLDSGAASLQRLVGISRSRSPWRPAQSATAAAREPRPTPPVPARRIWILTRCGTAGHISSSAIAADLSDSVEFLFRPGA